MSVTRAERQALEAVLRHGTAKDAATALGKSPRTIEGQLHAARQRNGVERTIELVRIVFIDPSETSRIGR